MIIKWTTIERDGAFGITDGDAKNPSTIFCEDAADAIDLRDKMNSITGGAQ